MTACWEDTMFVDARPHDDPLRCPICQDIMRDPVQCKKQHCFGKCCLKKALNHKAECPSCREKLRIADAQPSLVVRSIIDRLLVFCPRRDDGCRAQIALEALGAHEDKCGYAKVRCPHEGCSASMLRKDLDGHVLTCKHATMTCPTCKAQVQRSKMAQHSCLAIIMDRMIKLEAELTKERQAREKLEAKLDTAIKNGGIQSKAVPPLKFTAGPEATANPATTAKRKPGKAKAKTKAFGGLQFGTSSSAASASASAATSSSASAAAAPTAATANAPPAAAVATSIPRGKGPQPRRRPVQWDIVVRSEIADHDNGSLRDMAGWIVKDEDDHQPFNVKTMTRQPFWYRPTEVHYLCSPGDRVMMANAHKGLPVVRGQDWKWGDQDDKSYGHVAVSGLDRGDGWVEVKWTVSKETKCYRVGVENAYDLRVADMAQFDSG
eukprot:TRINITY_DN5786_c0_g1_i1.p1 TRINITY_DN5786_c0_g1~~TRINITY_DN5786_c0_g1_i1.p1  ORF type:complete len:435 (+),score=73.80 TRINITY_DN5786_c0_g1_i1:63-1367(+)